MDNLEAVREKLSAATDRFAAFEADALNVHVDFPLFQRLALPIMSGNSRVPGIKIHDTRMIRLMEVLLHSGTKLGGWRIAAIHQAILTAFGLKAEDYTLTQLRYDLRKMKSSRTEGARRQALLLSTIRQRQQGRPDVRPVPQTSLRSSRQ